MKPRRAYDAGHKPKFLVVIDDTPECDRAFHFAVRRAARTGARVLLLSVITPAEFSNWFGVGDVMREEAEAEVKSRLVRFAGRARSLAGLEPERVVREGSRSDELLKLIHDDPDVALVVLAAGSGNDGPGPLVTSLVSHASGTFPIPIAIVPGHLSDEEIDALA
jgi:nucleotide-binding universal stress UspA family protein